MVGAGDDLDGVREGAVEGVGEGDGKCRGEKVDVKLQVALGVDAVNPQSSAATTGGADKVEG